MCTAKWQGRQKVFSGGVWATLHVRNVAKLLAFDFPTVTVDSLLLCINLRVCVNFHIDLRLENWECWHTVIMTINDWIDKTRFEFWELTTVYVIHLF